MSTIYQSSIRQRLEARGSASNAIGTAYNSARIGRTGACKVTAGSQSTTGAEANGHQLHITSQVGTSCTAVMCPGIHRAETDRAIGTGRDPATSR